MDYRSRWQEKRRERAIRQRAIVIAVALLLIVAAVVSYRGLARRAPAGYHLAGPATAWLSAGDDAVLVTTRGGELLRLSPDLRETDAWPGRFTHPVGFWGRAAVAGGFILVGSEDVRVRGIDLATGVQSWELEVGGAVHGVTAAGEYACFASSQPALHAATAAGAEIWRTPLDTKVAAAPLVTEQTVVVGTLGGSICAFDRGSGERLWCVEPEVPAQIYATPAMGPSSILVGDDAGRLHSISRSGELLASMEFEGLIRRPVAVSDAVVVAGDSSGLIRRINPADMTEIWSARLSGPLSAEPIIRGGLVWCAVGRQLVALDAEDGSTEERRIAEALISDAIAAHGRIYWATTDGHIGAVTVDP